MQESPLFVKTCDLLAWLIPATLKFPKAQRLQNAAFDFYDAIAALSFASTSQYN